VSLEIRNNNAECRNENLFILLCAVMRGMIINMRIRKSVLILLAVVLGFLILAPVTVFAQEELPGQTSSDPEAELIVLRYDIGGGNLIPGRTQTLTIVFLNKSDDYAAKNVNLSFFEESGQILPKDKETTVVNNIAAGGQYTWRLRVFATGTVESRPYTATISVEYEAQNATAVTTTYDIILPVQGGATPAAITTPKLIVEQYDIGSQHIVPGEIKTLSVIFQNTSSMQKVQNIKFSFSEESGQILPGETGTVFVESIEADGQYKWQFDVFTIRTAESRPYAASISMEYEDPNGTPIIMTDTIYLYVHQPVRLEHDNIVFPSRLTQMDSVPFSVTLMNLGKSNILNALLTYEIPGLSNGSSVLIGTILPGESKTGTANFRVGKDVSGEVTGSLFISYEDEYGEIYKKEMALSTVIEERVEITPETSTQVEASTSNDYIWVIYISVGIIVVVILAFFIIKYIKQRKQIRADEMRL